MNIELVEIDTPDHLQVIMLNEQGEQRFILPRKMAEELYETWRTGKLLTQLNESQLTIEISNSGTTTAVVLKEQDSGEEWSRNKSYLLHDALACTSHNLFMARQWKAYNHRIGR